MRYLILVTFLIPMFLFGCSGGGQSPASPSEIPQPSAASDDVHQLWGLWQFTSDPVKQTLDFVQLREGDFHLNVLPFLEPPVLLYLSLESAPIFNGNILDVDIGLRHPFLGLTEFTGFDVCGLFISKGSVGGFTDANLLMPGASDTHLMNPDGFSRWWNPTEFPNVGTVFGYVDGLLGSPDSTANFTATLNGYKYFCDDLSGPEAPLTEVTQANRGLFSPGKKNVRHYKIDLSGGLIFNYAVDANWSAPGGGAPWTAPDDFPAEANKQEAWRISVNEIENSLFNDGTDSGGDLILSIDVYDWFNADMNSVRVESPGNFAMIESATAVSSGVGFSTYEIDITNATPAVGSIDLLISVESEITDFGGNIPGTNTTAYFTYTSVVGTESPVSISTVWLDPVELTPNISDPVTNEISPCIAQETDNELKAFWYGYHSYYTVPPAPNPPYWTYINDDFGAYSSDGLNWSGKVNTFGTGSGGPGIYRTDHAKIAPHQGGSSASLISFMIPTWNFALFDNDRALKGWPTYSFMYPSGGFTNNEEVMTDASGYIYGVGDRSGNLRMTKTNVPNQCVATSDFSIYSNGDARLSHVRSWGCDSGSVLYMAYTKTSLDAIYIAHGNDSSNTSWTMDYLVWQGAGYDDIRDPSVHLVNDVIHLSFVRHNTSTGNYELCYTSGDVTSGFSTPVVAITSTTPIEDAHLQAGNYITHDFLGLAYQTGGAIWFTYSSDAAATWAPPEAVQTVSAVAQDPDMIFINHAGGLTQDFVVIWVQGPSDDDGCFTRMGHFIEN